MIDDPVNWRHVLVTLQQSDIYILNETVMKGSYFIICKVWKTETIQLN